MSIGRNCEFPCWLEWVRHLISTVEESSKRRRGCASTGWNGRFVWSRNREGCGGATCSTAPVSCGRSHWSYYHCAGLSKVDKRARQVRAIGHAPGQVVKSGKVLCAI